MSLRAADEETPFLQVQRPKQKKGRTPLPWRQLSIILFIHLVAPFTSQTISPFAPQLIRDIGVTNGDETQVGHYVGLLDSLFYAAQALTVLHWSRLSDHIGRKPVALTGLVGLSASMYCFGLSKTFVGLVMSLSLDGVINGNIGIEKSMLMEITDDTNFPQGYAYMSISWFVGATLGPYIGGSLAKPVDRFPDVFGNWEFFKTYPYFLACAVPATLSVLAWVVTFLFLKETHPFPVSLRQFIKNKFYTTSATGNTPPASEFSSETSAIESMNESREEEERPLPLRALLVPRVLIATSNYATLSLLDTAFRTLQPVFFATPVGFGGLGLDPPRIGNILSISGLANGLFQVFFFAGLHDRFGSKAIYSATITAGILLTLTFPLLNALVRIQGLTWIVWAVIGMQLALSIILNLGFPCIFMYIAAASPNRASLGATNGLAQQLASFMRVIGPASAASMFSISIQAPERAWFVYYYLGLLVCVAGGASSLLPRKVWRRGEAYA